MTYHPDLRRISQALLQKTQYDETSKGQLILSSILTQNFENSGIRDLLLTIGRLSPIFSLLKTISSQEDFKDFIKNITTLSIEELNHCFYETKSTR